MGLASTTVPCAVAPCSIRVVPSTVTGSATVAAKPWPGWLWSELRPSLRRTVITLPAGITIGWVVALAEAPEALPEVEPPGAPAPAPELSADPGVGGLLPQPRKKVRANISTTWSECTDFTQPSQLLR